MSLNLTGIEWVKNPDGSPGYSFNPITGCLNNCPYCYARKLANTRLKDTYLANKNIAPYQDERDYMDNRHNPFHPRFWEDRMLGSFNHNVIAGKEKGIFVCDMSDLFGIGIPHEWQVRVFEVIKAFPEHRFYLLTKQPQNLIKFQFPDNCWVGATATDQAMFDRALYYLGLLTEAKLKFISLEPFLSPMQTTSVELWDFSRKKNLIDWVIIGACTGNITDLQRLASENKGTHLVRQAPKWTLQPKIEWVREIVEVCDKVGIPVFLKKNLEPLWTLENRREPFFKFSRPSPGATEIGHLRQEMPSEENSPKTNKR